MDYNEDGYEMNNPNLFIRMPSSGYLWSSNTYPWHENAVSIIDSYSESNQTGAFAPQGSGSPYVGQSFTNTSECTLDSCAFLLKKNASDPTGDISTYVYAHTGTYGTSSKPTGSPLATSNVINISSVTTDYLLYTFNFSGQNRITLSADTKYVVVLKYAGSGGVNPLLVGTDSSPTTHSGNRSSSTDGISWSSLSSSDVCFYVYAGIEDRPLVLPWTFNQGY